MSIVSTFFSGRAGVRAAKAELGGKVIDNGAGAETGKRWELQHESLAGAGAGKSQIIAADISPVLDVKAANVDSVELVGVPVAGATTVPDDLAGAVVFDDINTAIDELAAVEQAMATVRETIPMPTGLRYTGTRLVVLSDRKNKAINVTVKRSTTAARLAAHMAK